MTYLWAFQPVLQEPEPVSLTDHHIRVIISDSNTVGVPQVLQQQVCLPGLGVIPVELAISTTLQQWPQVIGKWDITAVDSCRRLSAESAILPHSTMLQCVTSSRHNHTYSSASWSTACLQHLKFQSRARTKLMSSAWQQAVWL